MTRTRIEMIKRKRSAVEKYLKKDIADLLKNGLDSNAYGRAEGLLVETNLSSCYDFVDQCCILISLHLSTMNKQRECPEECREAVPSVMFAAARFSDLPELRELRSLFAERYGDSLDHYINQEFVKKLKSMLPTKEKKFRVMQDLALESGIEWNSKVLEQKLYNSSEQNLLKHNKDDNRQMPKINTEPENKGNEYKQNGVKDFKVKENNQNGISARGKKDITNNVQKSENNEEIGQKSNPAFEMRRTIPIQGIQSGNMRPINQNSARTASDNGVEEKQANYKLVPPPPYQIKPIVTKSEPSLVDPYTSSTAKLKVEAKPVPRSVRRTHLKPPPGHENIEIAKQALRILDGDRRDKYKTDNGEKVIDKLLLHYSTKQSPSEHVKVESSRPHLVKQEHVFGAGKGTPIAYRSKDVMQTRQTSLPTEPTSPIESTKGHARSSSYQPDILNHVHPNLPDYDDFVARLAALRGK